MDAVARYEIIDTIGAGDFAVVYRARDRELGREVAIKQIHQQFLSDPRQLDRYWHEAQLLASLPHPNILTIHDIVRPRGWLILELMRGSLRPYAEGQPIDLDFLRVVLRCGLTALQFLHANGVVHGDIKPSNMLVDAQNQIKLGDFGLARRANSDEGSLLKGTTKYMAPELVTNQFGPVGPASDLYSLGFSAYELMCGERFETLFPGLHTFGRDRQIAWMMWHAAADRNLPQIPQVLEGVPEDLARVVQNLVVKDQSRRYQSAEDALRDLQPPPVRTGPVDDRPDPEVLAARRRKRQMRYAAAFAVIVSAFVSFAMLLPERVEQAEATGQNSVRGVVRNIYPDERRFVVELDETGVPEVIDVRPRDRIFINQKAGLLRDLQPGDKAVVTTLEDEDGRPRLEIAASRPQTHKGTITEIRPDDGTLLFEVDEGDQAGETLTVGVPRSATIEFNGRDAIDGARVMLADLQPKDRIIVTHTGTDTGRLATQLEVRRIVESEGTIRDLNKTWDEMTFDPDDPNTPGLITLPFAPGCEVTINGMRFVNEQVVKPGDLRPGDRVKLAHDVQIVRVAAERLLGRAGVVRKVYYDAGAIEVDLEADTKPTRFAVNPQTTISLEGEAAELGDLRDGDRIEVTHESLGAEVPVAKTIAAVRPADPSRWAVIVGVENYDDTTLTKLRSPIANAQLVRNTLLRRYAVPEKQALLLIDPSRVRLEQGVVDLIKRLGGDDKLIVYYSGHAYRDTNGKTYLAPKDFQFRRMAESGVSLEWFVEQLDGSDAGDKLLLLDACHAGNGKDLEMQPSTAEMLQSLGESTGDPGLRTMAAVSSCSVGQRGYYWPEKQHGLFAWCAAEGYSGKADKNRDGRLEVSELFAFLQPTMISAGAEAERVQSPALFLPDDTPPRLTAEAKRAIRGLAATVRQETVDLTAVQGAYAEAKKLAEGQVEPDLLYGLALLKAKQRDEAMRHFEVLRIEHPALLLPLEAAAWIRFTKRSYQPGIEDLIELVGKLPRPKAPADPLPNTTERVLQWCGRLREFADSAAKESRQPDDPSIQRLDAAVATLGDASELAYREGREHVETVLLHYDTRMQSARDEATRLKLGIERRNLAHYVSFPLAEHLAQVLAGLDQ